MECLTAMKCRSLILEVLLTILVLTGLATLSIPTVHAQGSTDGDNWFIILGSFPKENFEDAKIQLRRLRKAGHPAYIIDTEMYPNLKGGLWAVVMGPYLSKQEAIDMKESVSAIVSDAYIKTGWATEVDKRWFIVLGSFPRWDAPDAKDRVRLLRDRGYRAYLIDTGMYPNFRGGLWAVVMGPYASSQEAHYVMEDIKTLIPDAYVKSGWQN